MKNVHSFLFCLLRNSEKNEDQHDLRPKHMFNKSTGHFPGLEATETKHDILVVWVKNVTLVHTNGETGHLGRQAVGAREDRDAQL
jgi:hypothetical protein